MFNLLQIYFTIVIYLEALFIMTIPLLIQLGKDSIKRKDESKICSDLFKLWIIK